jgi:hypothetical protein
MRYPKGSIQLNQSRDLPLLRQILRSEFVTHSQLLEFTRLNHYERRLPPHSRGCAEVDGYLRSLPSSWEETLRVWRELESYREMIPQGICVEEREFFVSQMHVALDVLSTAPDWPRRELSSWRFLPPAQQLRRHLEN